MAFVSPLHRSLMGQTVAQRFHYVHFAASSNGPQTVSVAHAMVRKNSASHRTASPAYLQNFKLDL